MKLTISLGWMGALLILMGMCSLGGIWASHHRVATAEMLRATANKVDPTHSVKYVSTCVLQGKMGDGEYDWQDLAKAQATDFNSETYLIPPGAIASGAPLQLVAGFGTMTVSP